MTAIEGTIFCNNCGVEITWAPIVVKGCHFCCHDCLNHLQCECGDRMEFEEERRQSENIPVIPGSEAFS